MPTIAITADVDVFVDALRPDHPSGTIVFLHGWPLSGGMFERQCYALARRGLQTFALDMRGFGRSSKPFGPYGYDVWADDLDAVLTALDIREATLAGFSMGGAVAMHYVAQREPRRVARLALLGAAGPCLGLKADNPSGVPQDVHDALIVAALADRARMNAEFGELLFHRPGGPNTDRFLWSLAMQASPVATVRGLEELRDRDLRSDMHRINIPTLICHGAYDKVIPYALGAEVQKRMIPHATLSCFQDSGHGLFFDEADKLNDMLYKFTIQN